MARQQTNGGNRTHKLCVGYTHVTNISPRYWDRIIATDRFPAINLEHVSTTAVQANTIRMKRYPSEIIRGNKKQIVRQRQLVLHLVPTGSFKWHEHKDFKFVVNQLALDSRKNWVSRDCSNRLVLQGIRNMNVLTHQLFFNIPVYDIESEKERHPHVQMHERNIHYQCELWVSLQLLSVIYISFTIQCKQ